MRALIALCLVLVTVQVSAEPSGLVRKLMENGTTMFEMGLLRVEMMLNQHEELKNYSVHYEWDTNQIKISRALISLTSRRQADVFCTEGKELKCIDYVKKKLTQETRSLCWMQDGKCVLGSGVSYYFVPRGFSRKNFYDGKPSEVAMYPLDDMTVTSIKYFGDTYIVDCEKFIKSEKVKCSSEKAKKE